MTVFAPRRPVFVAVALAALSLAPTASFAAETIGSLAPQTNPSSGHIYIGATFTVPVGETGLTSGALLVHNDAGVASGTLGIYTYSEPASVPIGAPIAVTPFSLPGGSAQALAANFNVAVAPGATYVLLLTWASDPSPVGSYFGNDYYAGGNFVAQGFGTVPFPLYDLSFQVNFGAIPEPASLAALAAAGLVLVRRRR